MWWAALVALAVNDHVLKGSALLPPHVTGKLSDIAGLIVAPLLLSRLLHGRLTYSSRRAGLAFIAVGAVFVLINISQAFANWVAAVPGVLGVPSRLWADPTDLLALMVLPIAWKLDAPRRSSLRNSESRKRPFGRGDGWSRMGVAAGGLACVATSTDYERIHTAAYLFNVTRHELTIDIRPAREGFDCEELEEDPMAVLTVDAFEEGSCNSVKPYDKLALDPHAFVEDEEAPTDVPHHCDAAVIRIEGAAPSLLVWESTPQTMLQGTDFEEILADPHSVLVEELGDRRYLAPGEHIRVMEVMDEDAAPAPACGADE